MNNVKRRVAMRSRLRIPTFLAAVLLVGVALSACGGSGAQNTDNDSGDINRDGEFRFAIPFSPLTLDPHQGTTREPLWLRNVYDNLLGIEVKSDGSLEVGPALATSFEYADDGLSVEFELRDDVTFHDGTQFDAEAVKSNIERAKTLKESTFAVSFSSIKSVDVVDDTHVVFQLSRPDPALAWTLATTTGGMMVNPAAFDTDLATTPSGSGPFTLVSGQGGQEMVFERWDDHWNPDAALVKRLSISEVVDANARYNGVRSGQYDAAWMSNPLDARAKTLEADGYKAQVGLGAAVYGLYFNTSVAPFGDVRVRRAVAMALNRPEIVNQLDPLSEPIDQAFAEGTVGHDPDLEGIPYDPEAARRLLKEAGAAGKTVKFVATTTPPFQAMIEAIQHSLKDVGLNVELLPLSASEATPTFLRGGHAAVMTTISTTPEPSANLTVNYLGGSRTPTPPPAELVEMAEKAAALPAGSEERDKAYREINRYLTIENPITVPIGRTPVTTLATPHVVGDISKYEGYLGMDLLGVGVSN